MKDKSMIASTIDPTKPYHWFASSVVNWATGTSLVDVIKRITKADKASGLKIDGFQLFFVPCSDDVDYKIEFYAPQVEGAVYLGMELYNKEKDIKAKQEYWDEKVTA